MISKLLVALIVVGSQVMIASPSALDASTFTYTEGRTVEIVGAIDRSFHRQIAQVRRLADESSEPIYLIINSPGGTIYHLFLFLSAMDYARGKGVTFNCMVDGIAMSAAFSILAECDTRHAWRTSLLMFHPAWVGINRGVGDEELRRILTSLRAVESYLILRLRQQLEMDEATFRKHYEAQTTHPADTFNSLSPRFLQIVHAMDAI